jgi:two-component system chemotaxis response regulator CheY
LARSRSLPVSIWKLQMKTILIVDDSTTMRRMIIAALRGLGDVTFEQAVSGLDAMERLVLAPVDLMVLDLNMPDVHGYEVLRFVRTHEAFERLPVLVLTTRSDDASRATAMEEGATAYLTKPFAPETLLPEVRRLLPT